MNTVTINKSTAIQEQKFILPGCYVWQEFKAIQSLIAQQQGVKISYLDGVIELMTLGEEHETIKSMIAILLGIYFWQKEIEFIPVGSAPRESGDLMATVAELTGVKPPANLDSLSLVPTLLGRGQKQKKHEFLYREFHEGGSSQAVLMNGRWKGIRLERRTAPLELYDLQNDIGEGKNVAAEHPEIVAEIEAYLKTARNDNPDWPLRDAPPSDDQTKSN
jgi:hypothetical protein